jgi:2-keto-4-pentenoate hydratase/2-oxohepta-3-ene-1,7-dioic acid hydratase in catechol pathway
LLPIEVPQKIVCVGRNYAAHAHERGSEVPAKPRLFAKWPNSLIGPGEAIVLPPGTETNDYEGELGVVIGKRVKRASVDDALEAVAGYLCLNDVSNRAIQEADVQNARAKSFDTYCPVGPRLVPAGEIVDPQSLRIRTILNGEVVQDASTAEMIYGVAAIIAFASEYITLEPGDLIATGTPDGVGVARTPPLYLKPGDEITVEIEGIGALTNPVVAGEGS